MRIVDAVERVKPARSIRVGGTACMAAAWMLVATAALAQAGAAQSGLAQNESAQERLGVSRPDPATITVTPYSDTDAADGNTAGNTSAAKPLQQVKPSAAVPAAATNRKATATVLIAAGNGDPAAKGNGTAGFDPDANIVTAETAGRADRQLLNGAQDTPAKGNSDAGIVTRVPSRAGEVPEGTLVKVKLLEELSTLTTRAGTNFSAEVSEPVMRDGQVVVPAGALLEGMVTFVRGGKRVGASAAIHLEASTVTLPDGLRYLMQARVIDTNSWDDTKVDNEGTILRKDHVKSTEESIGLATGGGMAAGAVVGGVPGALIGAGVGAGVSTAVWMRQDRQADLPKDLGIIFSLTEPMHVTPMSAQLTRPARSGGAE